MRGREILNDPSVNRGTAFTREERDRLGLHGLLPPRVETQEEQVARIIENCDRKPSDIERYIFLMALQDRNEALFYRTIIDHLRKIMPLVYTPTVGQAGQEYGHIFRSGPRGLYVTAEDRGSIGRVLDNWAERDVRVIVVTDGERILGLGDLGANGMVIPLGKLALYSAAGGIDPAKTLPILLDVGTNNESLRADPMYLGLRQPRLTGDEYLEFIDEFVEAVEKRFPNSLIQFEDFSTPNAHKLLARYRDRHCSFNDDIQGTAAVGLAGLLAALRITGGDLVDQRAVFLGAGSANTGIGDLFIHALVEEGVDQADALRRVWLIDSGGLVVRSRSGLASHKRPFAHEHEPLTDLVEVIETIAPTALIGATGYPGTFDRPALEAMARINRRPIVFALSNPTSKSECTAEQAYEWTDGRVVFASGSPFDAVEYGGKTVSPGQANNVYVFPGMGLGVMVSEARRVTREMFLDAARAAASVVTQERLDEGSIFPPLAEIRKVSAAIAVAVCRRAAEQGLARAELPADLEGHVLASMYWPEYTPVD
jgi:malate dehydrogenase (oxaloacetate-decarboxylating)(NADP+)